MTDLNTLEKQLRAVIGSSAKFWPAGKAKIDDYYEAYLWSEVIDVASQNGWNIKFVNAGPASDEFVFRRAPGLLNSKKIYTYAEMTNGTRSGELHIGVRVRGSSDVLHEFDVVALEGKHIAVARSGNTEPTSIGVRLHIEAKFYQADLSLGIGRALVGLGADCPGVHPFLVSRAEGPSSIRALVKAHGGTYVHNAFPNGTGVNYLRNCLEAALYRWH